MLYGSHYHLPLNWSYAYFVRLVSVAMWMQVVTYSLCKVQNIVTMNTCHSYCMMVDQNYKDSNQLCCLCINEIIRVIYTIVDSSLQLTPVHNCTRSIYYMTKRIDSMRNHSQPHMN